MPGRLVNDRFRRLIGGAVVAACCAFAPVAGAADRALTGTAPGIDADKFFSALVKVRTHALPDARSAATLGTDREGTGIVIDDKDTRCRRGSSATIIPAGSDWCSRWCR